MSELSLNPAPLEYAVPAPRVYRPFALIGIAATAILFGPVVGTTTNAINGLVSPKYFVVIMGWQVISDVWAASIAQGVIEGLAVGMIFSTIFTTTVGLMTRATCTYRTGLRSLLQLLVTVYCLWCIGGIIGVALAASSPEFFQATFIGAHCDTHTLLRFAWVGGSIWGEEFGGFLAVIIGLVLFRARWKRETET